VWDVLSDQEAIDIAAQHFPGQVVPLSVFSRCAYLVAAQFCALLVADAEASAAAIGRAAFDKGSLDNITTSVCVFEWQKDRGRGVLDARLARHKKLAEEQEDIDMFG
jgi:serine/threonine protein phosphatase PrpC